MSFALFSKKLHQLQTFSGLLIVRQDARRVVDVNEADMAAVIEAMNGREVMGRELAVNEAQPREERAPRKF